MAIFKRVPYSSLTSRQKENFNFQKVSAVLADFGFMTMRLSDDWQGADFIAQHVDGIRFVKIQLKSRPAFAKKYMGKDLFIAYSDGTYWYLYPHDDVLDQVLQSTGIKTTDSWAVRGGYSWKSAPAKLAEILVKYRLA